MSAGGLVRRGGGEEGDRLPVVLIHGALRSRAGLWPTAWYLRRFGLDARPFGYDTRGATLAEHGASLERFVEAWQAERPFRRIGILTHSMGGLVARAYLARPSAVAQCDEQRLVMLAPPNQGAWLAAKMRGFRPFHWLYGAAAEELQPERASRLPPPPPSARVLILAGGALRGDVGLLSRIPGNNDGLVRLAETALPGIEPVLVGGSHSVLQWRREVLKRAIDFLAQVGEAAAG
ncbi:MAG: hypothetical protein R3B09_19755 [Nannocystaceae bacterium]